MGRAIMLHRSKNPHFVYYLHYLRKQFPGLVMSKGDDWPWPHRSPDLTLCDFFIWGYMKHKMGNVPHDQQPHNLSIY